MGILFVEFACSGVLCDYLQELRGSDETSELRKILDVSGLKCCSHHERFENIEEFPDKVFKKVKELGCGYIVSAIPKKVDFEKMDDVKKLTESLNRMGKFFKTEGISLVYHNHNMEFTQTEKGITCLEYIYNETDPEYVQSQLDIYWIQLGGGNPVSWCKKMKGRMPSIHLNDYKVSGGTKERPIKIPVCTEVGHGNLELSHILSAATSSGCKWFIIECHDNWIDSDPFKSLQISFSYLKKNFC